MRYETDEIVFELIDDGPLDTVVRVTVENDGIEQEIACSQDSAVEYQNEDGTFTQQSFEEFCEDVVSLGIDWTLSTI